MAQRYFRRVAELTPTKFWINNPTRDEAGLAITEGAVGCTNNPSYPQKMVDHPEEGAYALRLLDEMIAKTDDDDEVLIEHQARLVQEIADIFRPMYDESGGRNGYVSIQGDPIRDEDTELIIRQSLENREIGPNIACKIPTTIPGLAAMEKLVPLGVPINATEIFAVNQMTMLCDAWERLAKQSGQHPMLFMSHITGIYDQYLGTYVAENHIDISPDIVWQAGMAVARKVYGIMKDRGYSAMFVGGGARGLQHFTEMVGGDACITINWKGTADKLLEQDPPVVERLFTPVPSYVIDELLKKLPDFRRGYLDDGLEPEEFEAFGPVQLFRNSFTKSWTRVKGLVAERRVRG
ncbi:MAG: transaldolase family protein [Actinomycetota bacterium]